MNSQKKQLLQPAKLTSLGRINIEEEIVRTIGWSGVGYIFFLLSGDTYETQSVIKRLDWLQSVSARLETRENHLSSAVSPRLIILILKSLNGLNGWCGFGYTDYLVRIFWEGKHTSLLFHTCLVNLPFFWFYTGIKKKKGKVTINLLPSSTCIHHKELGNPLLLLVGPFSVTKLLFHTNCVV